MKILVIQADQRLLLPEEAGTPRPFHHCRGLSENHELHYVTVSSISGEDFRRFAADERVRRLFRSVHHVDSSGRVRLWRRGANLALGKPFFDQSFKRPEFLRRARQRVGELVADHGLDRLLCFSLASLQYAPPSLRPRTVGFVADLMSMKYRRGATVLWKEGRWAAYPIHRACAWTTRRYERRIYGTLSAVVFNSSHDASLARRRAPAANIGVVPNGCDLEFFSPDGGPAAEKVANLICFLGAMSYDPNADAAVHFARDILPRIRRQIPGARFVAVGGDPPQELQKLHDGQSVQVTGYVEDVRGYLKSAAVVVSPLRYGAGMKNKLLIGLAMRKPMVVSSVTCEGFEDVVDGEHVLVADEAELFAGCVVRLLTNPELAARLATAGNKLITERYSWASSTGMLEAILQDRPERPGRPSRPS